MADVACQVALHNVAVLHLQSGVGGAGDWWTVLEAEVFSKAAELGGAVRSFSSGHRCSRPLTGDICVLDPAGLTSNQIGGAHSRGYIGSLLKSQRALAKLMGFLGVSTAATAAPQARAQSPSGSEASGAYSPAMPGSSGTLGSAGADYLPALEPIATDGAGRRVKFVADSSDARPHSNGSGAVEQGESSIGDTFALPPINASATGSGGSGGSPPRSQPTAGGKSRRHASTRTDTMRRKMAAAQGLSLKKTKSAAADEEALADESSNVSVHSGHFMRQMNAVSIGMLMNMTKVSAKAKC